MTNGARTPEITREEFRAHYLYSGNASESSRVVGLNERTGRDLARELLKDPDFTEARRELRAIEVDESVAARRRVRQKALERFESDDGGIDVKRFGGEDGTVVVTDRRHEYGKLVLEADKNAQAHARFDAERDGTVRSPGEVTINVTPTLAASARIAEANGAADGGTER